MSSANHVRWCDKNPKVIHKRKLEKPKICPKCNCNFDITYKRRNKYCSIECSRGMSVESRKKISESRKKYLHNNPNQHPWKRSNKHISHPCEIVKNFLTDSGISYIDEWTPLEDRYFSIDIAFPDIQLGIEINGNQHYNSDGTLKKYYQDRHDLIESSGWTLIELHYSIAYNLEKLKTVINIIHNREQPDYSEYFKDRLDKINSKKALNTQSKQKSRQEKLDLKWEPYKEKVLDSGIDFSKFGWVNRVSKVIDLSPQHVGRWMEHYLPDLYSKCYKRNPRS